MSPKRKLTIVMEDAVVYGMQDAVERGFAKSQSAFIEKAVIEHLKKAKDQWLRNEWQRAADDPEFMADMNQVMHDFRFVDAENWPDA